MRIFYDVDTQNDFMNKNGALYVPDAELIKQNLALLTNHAKQNHVLVLGSVDKHFGTEEYKHREGELKRWGGPFPDHCMENALGQLKINETTLVKSSGMFADWMTQNENDYGLYIQHPLYHNWSKREIPNEVREARNGLTEEQIKNEWEELINGIEEHSLLEAIREIKKVELKQTQRGIYLEKQHFDVFANPNTEELFERARVSEAIVYGVATDYCVKAAVLGMQKRGIQTYVVSDAIKGVFPESTKSALEEMANAGAKFVKTRYVLKGRI